MIKKLFFLNALILLSLCTRAQKVIQMEKEGGVYKISCTVNGARMKMIFDTGAAAVSLSMTMASYLYENDYIKKEDIVGKGKSQTADGTIVDHVVINLRDIEISGLHIKNIKATVIDGQNVPLLFGQTAMNKLGSYTIDGDKLILNEYKESFDVNEINRLKNTVNEAYKSSNYYFAIECLEKIKSLGALTGDWYALLVSCYKLVKNYPKAKETALITLKHNDLSEVKKISVYLDLAIITFELDEDQECIKYSEMVIQKSGSDYKMQYFGHLYLGLSYEMLDNNVQSEKHYIKAVNNYAKSKRITNKEILSGKVEDEELGFLFESLGFVRVKDNNKTIFEKYVAMGAICQNKRCLGWCRSFKIDFKKICKKTLRDLARAGNQDSSIIFSEE